MNSSQVFVLLVLVTTAHISFAKSGYGPGDQDWGYVDVREGAHMFYWLHKTIATVDDVTQRPLIIWLQGGPGCSSTGIGNFMEIGPLKVNGNYRQSTWVKEMNVLFIDSPVGSGFSYVDNSGYFTTNNSQIALDLVECMKGFFATHKEFENVPLHIFTESYGGKMGPEFALELHKAKQRGDIKCKITSLAMGNPWTSPMDTMLSYAPFLFYAGIIDEQDYSHIMNLAIDLKKVVENEQWNDADKQYFKILNAIHSVGVGYYNILEEKDITNNQGFFTTEALKLKLLMRESVSKALGIPAHVQFDTQYQQTYYHLVRDSWKPAVHIVSELLETTDLKVGVYSGQWDLACNTVGILSWIKKLKWSRSHEYFQAEREPIAVNDLVEGYEKSGGNFYMFWVNRAGHFVPPENPAAMSYILKKFTKFG